MLILGRRPGESILIAGNIRLVVISCDKRGVRLGIEAPPDIVIVRGELVTPLPTAEAGAGTLAAVGPGRRAVGGEGPAAPDPTVPAPPPDDEG